jgi:hypothetical protein
MDYQKKAFTVFVSSNGLKQVQKRNRENDFLGVVNMNVQSLLLNSCHREFQSFAKLTGQ